MVAFMVVQHEVIELVAVVVLLIDLPTKESPERIALHKAVEQSADLLWPPYEFALNRWQYDVVPFDLAEGFRDGDGCLV